MTRNFFVEFFWNFPRVSVVNILPDAEEKELIGFHKIINDKSSAEDCLRAIVALAGNQRMNERRCTLLLLRFTKKKIKVLLVSR